MTYVPVTIDSASDELNRLHESIEENLRRTVGDAIRAGEILNQVKDRLAHGQFLPWIEANCSFTDKTAENYMKLHRHSRKIETVSNLQEAYKEVARLESIEQQTERQKATQRVREYRKTGVKPEGWRRGTDDKLVEEEESRDRRIDAAKAKMQAATDQREAEEAERKARREQGNIEQEVLEQAAGVWIARAEKRKEFKERIKLSQSGESDQFIEALMDYLEELDDDNRRIEACQNIIKVCRNIAAELQRG